MTIPLEESHSYESNEWNPHEDGKESETSSAKPDESSEEESSSQTSDAPTDSADEAPTSPQPAQPNPEKTVDYTETDLSGHKIVYYTDGTREDLGRVTAIDFSSESPSEKYGYQYFSTLSKGDGLCALYNDLYNVSDKFHKTEKDLVKTGGNYVISKFDFAGYGLTKNEAAGVWRTVCLEYPEFFWWGRVLIYDSNSITLVADEAYAKASARKEAQEAIEEMAYACDGYLDGTTTLVERALTIHDYVANITEYAYEQDGVTPEDAVWAHNLTGGALYGKGVCENYSKTYQYLCGLFGVDCMIVTGDAIQDGETIAHGWNVIGIEGNWYNVDVTWDDGDGTSLAHAWFGTGNTDFSETHDALTPADGWGVNYQLPTPSLSDASLTPVRALRGEPSSITEDMINEAPMYASIEEVFALMQGGNAYTAYLYPTTDASPAGVPVATYGATINEGQTPSTGSLSIVGEYREYEEGYYSLATLDAPNGLTLGGNLFLSDLRLSAPSVSLGRSRLTTGGTAVELEASGTIAGTASSHLVANTSGWTELTKTELYKITVQTGECRLIGGGTVQYANLESGMLRLYGASDATVTNLWFASKEERLYIDNATSTTKISVGTITAGSGFFVPSYVNFFVVYDSATNYPNVTVNAIQSGLSLYYTMYSTYLSPQNLGVPILTLGTDFAYANLRIGYTSGGTVSLLSKNLFEKKTTGEVCAK